MLIQEYMRAEMAERDRLARALQRESQALRRDERRARRESVRHTKPDLPAFLARLFHGAAAS